MQVASEKHKTAELRDLATRLGTYERKYRVLPPRPNLHLRDAWFWLNAADVARAMFPLRMATYQVSRKYFEAKGITYGTFHDLESLPLLEDSEFSILASDILNLRSELPKTWNFQLRDCVQEFAKVINR